MFDLANSTSSDGQPTWPRIGTEFDGNGCRRTTAEDLLGLALTDDVIIEESTNLTRVGQVVEAELGRFG